MPKKQLTGTVISNKTPKTISVKVELVKEHPIYRKKYRRHKKYLADVKNEKDYKIGDRVIIEECRPLSKKKKWRAIKKI